jgi:hypothetical protein
MPNAGPVGARARQLQHPDIDGDLVRKWEQFYAGQPDYVQRMAERGSRTCFISSKR